MIDFHCHILPQMDDGCKDVDESKKLWDMLQAQGVTTLAATSHFYPTNEAPEDYLRRREQAVAMLPDSMRANIRLGAEVAYFAGISNCDSVIPLQLEGTGLLLIEMPFTSWNARIIEDICAIPSQLGLTPVLAHVDRYRSQFSKYCHELVCNDVLFQCNAEAFQKGFSGRWAIGQLKKGLIHFLGSDAHNTTGRPPKLDQATHIIEKNGMGRSVPAG